MPDHAVAAKAVFLSYAREDAEPVRRIADALRAFGVEVWFDMSELRGGDAWDSKIKSQIRTCSLCIPVISAATQSRGEGYFRREWKIAVERTHDMASGVPFLLPVVIDDTAESSALVPEEFMKVQWTRLTMGVPTPQFIEQVKRLLSEGQGAGQPRFSPGDWSRVDSSRQRERKGQGGTRPPVTGVADPGRTASEPGSATPATRKSIPGWTWGALAAVVVGVVAAVIIARKSDPTSIQSPASSLPEAKPTPAPSSLVPSPATLRVADKSVAVLPFANMSEDKDASSFFSDGIQEDILTNLAFIRELRVVSRTSVMAYRGTTKPMKQIAQELGVTYILEGSVRRAGNKVRVTGQLIHAATDEHVWAQAYDRDITDVFAIQAELSQNIAAALKTVLSPEEKVLIARRPTAVPAAYDLYLQARDLNHRGDNSTANRGKQIEALEKAVLLDPDFAQAWGELADRYAQGYFYNDADNMKEQLVRAKAAIERAVALAPEDPDIISAQGTYYYYAFRDYQRATAYYEKLARLQPNSPSVFNSLALIQRRQGRWAESLANSRRACELDPASISYLRILIATLRAGRRWDDYLVMQRRLVTLLPGNLLEKATLATIPFLATGSTAEGDAFVAQLTAGQADSPEGIWLRRDWAAAKGDYGEAVRLSKLVPYYDGYGMPHWHQAIIQASYLDAIGDRTGAKDRLGNFPAELRELLAKEPNNLLYMVGLANMEARLGNKAEALRFAERYVALMPESKDALDGVSYAILRAAVYDMIGEQEKALTEYARLLRIPGPSGLNVHELKRDPTITIRDDPRFQALLNDPKNNAPLF